MTPAVLLGGIRKIFSTDPEAKDRGTVNVVTKVRANQIFFWPVGCRSTLRSMRLIVSFIFGLDYTGLVSALGQDG